MSDDKKSNYFNMSEAVDELRYGSFGAKEKAMAGLKLFGKGLFNATKYTVTEVLPAAVVRSSDQLLKNENLSDDQRRKVEEHREKASDYLKK